MAVSPRTRPADLRPTAAGPLARLLADPRRVLLVASALVGFAAGVDVLHDPDLFWHLRLGRWILDHHQVPHAELFSFTAQGNPMTAHEWGSEVVFTALNSVGGLLLVAVVMGVVAWSALIALGLRSRARGAGPVVTAVALLLGARAAEPVLGTRPQVITVALVCWTLLVAERHLRPCADAHRLGGPPPTPSAAAGVRPADSVPPGRGGRLLGLLPPVGLLWANLHGGVVLGLGALALLVILEGVRRALGRPEAAPWRRIGEVAAATAAAAALGCINPNGPGLYRYVVQTSGSERAKPITEWHTPDFHDPSNVGLLVLLVSFPLLIALGGRLNLRDLGMSVAGLAAALLAVRNTSLAVALALPAWALMLQQVVDRFGARRGRQASTRPAQQARPVRGGPAVVFGGVIVALALAVDGAVIARAAGDASASGVATTYPACAARALSSASGVRLVAPYFDSGYLIEQLWPRTRVFLYGESASLGMKVFDDYQRIFAGGPNALALLGSYGANAVLTGPGALHAGLAASGRWQMVLDDPDGLTLFATPELAPHISAPQHC